jgi:hypothetical protein
MPINTYPANAGDHFHSGQYIQSNGDVMNGTLLLKSVNTRSVSLGTVSGSVNLDMAQGNDFIVTVNGATTFNFTGVTASNAVLGTLVHSVGLQLINGGNFTMSFPGVKWAGGTVPTLTSSATDILSFVTFDGGTNWRGMMVSKDSK